MKLWMSFARNVLLIAGFYVSLGGPGVAAQESLQKRSVDHGELLPGVRAEHTVSQLLMQCGAAYQGDANVVDVDMRGTVTLHDGRKLVLAHFLFPHAPLYLNRVNSKSWPFAKLARAALREMIDGQRVGLYYQKWQGDRYGRGAVHLVLSKAGGEKKWVQAEMLRRGVGVYVPFLPAAGSALKRANGQIMQRSPCHNVLLRNEQIAQSAERGVWAHAFYRAKPAKDITGLMRLLYHYQVVAGRVHQVAERGGRAYINFSADWRTDFTAVIDRKYWKKLKAHHQRIKALKGKRLRIRGWIEKWNGPAIKISDLGQIEVMDK